MRPGRIAHRSCAAIQNPGTKYSPPPSPLHHPLIPLAIFSSPLGKALAICTRPHIPTQGDVHPFLDESTSTRAQCLWHRPGARARYGPLVRALGARRMEADPVDSRRHSPVGTLHPVHVMINSDLHPTLSDAKPLFFLLVPPSPPPLGCSPPKGRMFWLHQETDPHRCFAGSRSSQCQKRTTPEWPAASLLNSPSGPCSTPG